MEDKVLIYSKYHERFWGPDSSGYADNIEDAGFYTREQAESIVRGSPDRNVIKEIDAEVQWKANSRMGDLKARIERYEIILAKLKEFQEIIDKVNKNGPVFDAAVTHMPAAEEGQSLMSLIRVPLRELEHPIYQREPEWAEVPNEYIPVDEIERNKRNGNIYG